MVQVLISLDDDLIARLDIEAAARGMSRDALLGELAEDGLRMPVGARPLAEVSQALQELDQLLGEQIGDDSTNAIRAERDGH